jgi:hypothetical protein
MVGRLQTDADRERVVEGLVGSEAAQGDTLDGKELASILKALPPRTFFLRDVHAGNRSLLLETRWTLSWLRGPMTRKELKMLVADGRVLKPRDEAKAAEQKPAVAAAPSAPEGWRVLYPHPPKAPVDAWQYLPHAAVIARAEIADARLGVRTTREVSVMVPFANAGLDLDGAVRFEPDTLTHGPVPGARYVAYGELGTRALRSIEKALKEQALAGLRLTVMLNDVLELVSQPQETPQSFADRCTETAKILAQKARNELLAKHEPKVQRLAAERDAAHRTHAELVRGPKDKLSRAREKLASAQATLDEAVKRRDAELTARENELLRAPVETRTKELAPKKDALVIESFALVWAAG